MTVSESEPAPPDERSALGEIGDWWRRYLRKHPLASFHTVGGQVVLDARTVQSSFIDLAFLYSRTACLYIETRSQYDDEQHLFD